jgi:hypothetical protein
MYACGHACRYVCMCVSYGIWLNLASGSQSTKIAAMAPACQMMFMQTLSIKMVLSVYNRIWAIIRYETENVTQKSSSECDCVYAQRDANTWDKHASLLSIYIRTYTYTAYMQCSAGECKAPSYPFCEFTVTNISTSTFSAQLLNIKHLHTHFTNTWTSISFVCIHTIHTYKYMHCSAAEYKALSHPFYKHAVQVLWSYINTYIHTHMQTSACRSHLLSVMHFHAVADYLFHNRRISKMCAHPCNTALYIYIYIYILYDIK